ncbi:diacylglycerol/lipid kinase family protein [Peribacillus sp. B-H-3]|uniref:diacylglycerol/lipid kinase family protein n=1 Tax=Peribacillus sp. B-H-3 TaxID=3400420 RepID=UPI003B02B3A6
MTKAMIIINPSSGKEKAKSLLPQAEDLLGSLYDEIVVSETKGEGDATRFAEDACRNHFDAVVSMGGDGTVNETVNGLAEKEHQPDFGIIPLGTVNDFARAIGIPLDPEEALQLISLKKTVPADIGKVNERHFMNVLAVGAIAEATSNVSAVQKTKMGSLAYFVEGVKTLINKTPFTLTIEHDHGSWTGKTYLMLAAMTNSVGGFEKLAPHAEVDDGKMHIFIIKDISLPSILKILPKLMRGELKEHKQVEYIRSSSIAVTASEELIVNVDGDEGEPLPFQAKVLRKHLNFFVPDFKEISSKGEK